MCRVLIITYQPFSWPLSWTFVILSPTLYNSRVLCNEYPNTNTSKQSFLGILTELIPAAYGSFPTFPFAAPNHSKMQDICIVKALCPHRYSDAENAWWRYIHWLAGWCGGLTVNRPPRECGVRKTLWIICETVQVISTSNAFCLLISAIVSVWVSCGE